jgi:hypothetical protein
METATWLKAGQLDWWVKERQPVVGSRTVQTAVNGGSELLIFVAGAAHSHKLLLSFLQSIRFVVEASRSTPRRSLYVLGPLLRPLAKSWFTDAHVDDPTASEQGSTVVRAGRVQLMGKLGRCVGSRNIAAVFEPHT